jgi:hypothetical protein
MDGMDVHDIARERLAWATDSLTAASLMTDVLAEIGLPHLSTVDDLRRFGQALLSRGDVGRTVGSLLILHCGPRPGPHRPGT